jgi:hypothetical protein
MSDLHPDELALSREGLSMPCGTSDERRLPDALISDSESSTSFSGTSFSSALKLLVLKDFRLFKKLDVMVLLASG